MGLGQLSPDVFGTEAHLQRTSAPDQPRQPRHGPAAGDQADAHFPLREYGLLPTDKRHVAGQRDFAAVPGGAPSDQGDRDNRRARQAHEAVRPGLEPRRPCRYPFEILEICKEIAVVQEVAFDGAVKDHDLDLLVVLDGRHDFPEFLDELRAHHVERRIVERNPPVGGRHSVKPDLCCRRFGVHSTSWSKTIGNSVDVGRLPAIKRGHCIRIYWTLVSIAPWGVDQRRRMPCRTLLDIPASYHRPACDPPSTWRTSPLTWPEFARYRTASVTSFTCAIFPI